MRYLLLDVVVEVRLARVGRETGRGRGRPWLFLKMTIPSSEEGFEDDDDEYEEEEEEEEEPEAR